MDSQILALALVFIGLCVIFGLWGTLDILFGNSATPPTEEEDD